MNREQREDTRIEVQMTGEAILNIKGKESKMEVKAKNISAWGAFCVSDSRPKSGDEVELHLGWAPEDKQAQIVFKARGTILRVEVLPKEGYGFAVEFQDIPVLEGESDLPFA